MGGGERVDILTSGGDGEGIYLKNGRWGRKDILEKRSGMNLKNWDFFISYLGGGTNERISIL